MRGAPRRHPSRQRLKGEDAEEGEDGHGRGGRLRRSFWSVAARWRGGEMILDVHKVPSGAIARLGGQGKMRKAIGANVRVSLPHVRRRVLFPSEHVPCSGRPENY